MNKEVFPFVLKLFYVDNFLVSAWLGQQTTDLLLTRQHYLFAVLRVSTCYDLPQIKKIDIWRRVDDGEKVNSSEKTLIKPAALMLFVSVVIMSSPASKWQALLFSLSVISTSDFSPPPPCRRVVWIHFIALSSLFQKITHMPLNKCISFPDIYNLALNEKNLVLGKNNCPSFQNQNECTDTQLGNSTAAY